jgi:6-phosphofructo-2-kinase/fructose-2,6-biphosphatase 4
MHCSTMEIPTLTFPRDEIIEIIPAAYQNEAKRIHIPGLEARQSKTVPGSPNSGLKSPPRAPAGSVPPSVPASGTASGVASGQMSPVQQSMEELQEVAAPEVERPPEKVINTAKDMVADKVDDED